MKISKDFFLRHWTVIFGPILSHGWKDHGLFEKWKLNRNYRATPFQHVMSEWVSELFRLHKTSKELTVRQMSIAYMIFDIQIYNMYVVLFMYD